MTVNIEGFGKITASKDILNEIAIWAAESRDHQRKINNNALADLRDRVENEIYNALNATGYYN